MPAFTKGKWVFPEGKTCISTFDSNGCVERNIAEVYVDMPTPEFEANTRLIAEAPVMYDLLGKAWDALPDDHPLRYEIDACLCHVEGSLVPGEEDNSHETDA